MSPTISTYSEGSHNPDLDVPPFQIGIECTGLIIALAACVAILITGCYGPIGWNNEWPLIRALPKSWKQHIYPSRIGDESVEHLAGADDPDKPVYASLQARPPLRRWSSSPARTSSSTSSSTGTLVAKQTVGAKPI